MLQCSKQTTERHMSNKQATESNGYVEGFVTQMKEGQRFAFRMAKLMADEGDKQVAEGFRWLQMAQEQGAQVRANMLKSAEEWTDRAVAVAHAMAKVVPEMTSF